MHHLTEPEAEVPRVTPRHSHAAWVAATLGLCTSLVLFYPGFMSPDSVDQWMQVRAGAYTSTRPPMMAFIWSLTDKFIPGPGGLFVLHSTLLWFALGWLGRELFVGSRAQVAFVLLIGLWPPVFGTAAHLWKDMPMATFALLGMSALMRSTYRKETTLAWSVLALAFFTMACAYRYNALPLVLPFLATIAIQNGIHGMAKRTFAVAVMIAVVAVSASLPQHHPAVTKRDVWPVTALWDLAAVSVVRDRMLIPDDWRTPELSVDDLRKYFRPWSNTTIFDSGKLFISLYSDPTPEQSRSLRRAWLDLWVETPLEIAWHRLRLSALLFGFMPQQVPLELKLWLQDSTLPDASLVSSPTSAFREGGRKALLALAVTPMFAGWLYLVLLLVLAGLGRRREQHVLFWPTILSVGLYCLPLLLLAPSAEFRYLIWPVVAALIVLALFLTKTRKPTASQVPAVSAPP